MPNEIKQSLREYVPTIIRPVWAVIVGGIGGVLGVLDLTRQINVPLWFWLASGLIVLSAAQFSAFHKARLRRDELEGLMRPTLKIEFRNGEGVFFFKQPNTDHAVGYELYRVLLTNHGLQTVKKAQLDIVGIEPRPTEFFILPLRLRPRNSQSQDLESGRELLYDIAIYHQHSLDRFIIGTEIPRDIYTVRLRATGENVPPVFRVFRIYGHNGKLYMFPEHDQGQAAARFTTTG
jgi:hypothetical protein